MRRISLAEWYKWNKHLLKLRKNKELTVYFRKKEAKKNTPVYFERAEAEHVNSFKFLETDINKNLT